MGLCDQNAAESEKIAMIKIAKIIAVLCLMTVPLMAQRGATASSGDRGGTSSGTATASASSSSVSSGSDRGVSSSGGSYGSSARFSSYSGGTSSSGYSAPAPRLVGTSFISYGMYQDFQSFLFNLRSMYLFNYDTSRFMRNYEPLVTPQFAVMAARRPLYLSMQLLTVVDELSALLADAKAGKSVNKKEIEANTRQIRILAKAIRTDSSLGFVDRRESKDLLKGVDVNQLGVGAIDRLREIVIDLNTQLKSLTQESQTATISVDYLAKPSFVSLSKSIEKLSQVIERSAGRI
jgi:hypothetical protein